MGGGGVVEVIQPARNVIKFLIEKCGGRGLLANLGVYGRIILK